MAKVMVSVMEIGMEMEMEKAAGRIMTSMITNKSTYGCWDG